MGESRMGRCVCSHGMGVMASLEEMGVFVIILRATLSHVSNVTCRLPTFLAVMNVCLIRVASHVFNASKRSHSLPLWHIFFLFSFFTWHVIEPSDLFYSLGSV